MSPSEKTQPRLGGATQEVAGPSAGASPAAAADRAPRAPVEPSPADRLRAPSAPGDEHPEVHPDAHLEAHADAPRRVRLTVARVAPWSVAKLAFLLSVALGVVLVVAVALLWAVLDAMGVFADLDGVVRDVVGSETEFSVMDVVGLGRVLSVAIFVAVVDVVLLTALATLGAVIYNGASALVGGLRLTLSDD